MSRTAIAVAAAALLSCACTNIGEFSTGLGECYRGKIVNAPFILAGFAAGTQLSMTLDTNAIAAADVDGGPENAGVVWTSDGKFSASAITQMSQLANDSLSQFQFPGGRIRNYLVYVVAADGVPAMMVISLMENGVVEARIMRPETDICPLGVASCETPTPYEALYGVFRLDLEQDCTAPTPVR